MFDLKSYMNERSAMINRALEREMPSANTPPARLHEAMRYSVFSGGKRLRPILCLAAAEAVGAPTEIAILPAAAIEIFHTYTLIHDDLPSMDNDELRRGMPTSHMVYGEAGAILAGDALQALAFEILAKSPSTNRYPQGQLVSELARTAGSRGIVGGQFEDISLKPDMISADILNYIHLHKTADLFKTAVRLGGMAGNASENDLQSLTEYGTALGLAFQIADDLLDEKNKEKTTCLSIYDPKTARKKAIDLAGKAIYHVNSLSHGRSAPLTAIANFAVERKY